jgi:hypothetical protein
MNMMWVQKPKISNGALAKAIKKTTCKCADKFRNCNPFEAHQEHFF